MRLTTAVIAACFVAIPTWAAAQGGSTGGSLGKSGQELSGGVAKQPPANKDAKTDGAKTRQGSVSVSGAWKWQAQCANGSTWSGTFHLDHRPDGTLRGTCSTAATYGCGEISGRVVGTTATFTVFWSDPFGGHRNPFTFSITQGGRSMQGTEQSVANGICTYHTQRS